MGGPYRQYRPLFRRMVTSKGRIYRQQWCYATALFAFDGVAFGVYGGEDFRTCSKYLPEEP